MFVLGSAEAPLAANPRQVAPANAAIKLAFRKNSSHVFLFACSSVTPKRYHSTGNGTRLN
jgi:hypothetical protein